MLDLDQNHTYRYNGIEVPGVTEIMGVMTTFGDAPQEAIEKASLRGKAVHRATELYDQNDLDMNTLDPSIVKYLDAWVKFKRDTSFSVLFTEEKLFHPVYRYAGTIDRIGMMGTSHRCVLDIKCVHELSPATALQTAGYLALVEGSLEVSERYAIKLKPDGNYVLQHYTDEDDWRVFLSLLSIHNWRKKYAA